MIAELQASTSAKQEKDWEREKKRESELERTILGIQEGETERDQLREEKNMLLQVHICVTVWAYTRKQKRKSGSKKEREKRLCMYMPVMCMR